MASKTQTPPTPDAEPAYNDWEGWDARAVALRARVHAEVPAEYLPLVDAYAAVQRRTDFAGGYQHEGERVGALVERLAAFFPGQADALRVVAGYLFSHDDAAPGDDWGVVQARIPS